MYMPAQSQLKPVKVVEIEPENDVPVELPIQLVIFSAPLDELAICPNFRKVPKKTKKGRENVMSAPRRPMQAPPCAYECPRTSSATQPPGGESRAHKWPSAVPQAEE